MTRGTKLKHLALALPLAGAACLWAVQAPGPELHGSAWVSAASDDQALLATVAAYPDFDSYVRREGDAMVMTLPLARGAELLELARVSSASRYRTLTHDSPVVRAYAAMQLLMRHPAKAARLRPLLGDGATLARAEFGDRTSPAPTTVAHTVVDMLCAAAQEPAVQTLLADVARDLRYLRVWSRVHACIRP